MSELPRVVIGLPSKHSTDYAMSNAILYSIKCLKPSIDCELQIWVVLNEAIDSIVLQRRDVAVLCRGEPMKPCLSRMDDKVFASTRSYSLNEVL
jgi:hypothetical protein